MGFSETIVVYDIKVDRCSRLNEYIKLYEYRRSRSFIDLGSKHSDSLFLNFFSSITTNFNISSTLRWAIQDQWSFGLTYISSYIYIFLRWLCWCAHHKLDRATKKTFSEDCGSRACTNAHGRVQKKFNNVCDACWANPRWRCYYGDSQRTWLWGWSRDDWGQSY